MKIFTAPALEHACCPKASSSYVQENGAYHVPGGVVVAICGFGYDRARGLRISISTSGSRKRCSRPEVDWRVFARAKLKDHAVVPVETPSDNSSPGGDYEDGEGGAVEGEGDGEAPEINTEKIERRLVSGERILQISKAERNLGLSNSYEFRLPVRLIRGHKHPGSKTCILYSYDGLYAVVEVNYVTGVNGKKVYEFTMHCILGTPQYFVHLSEGRSLLFHRLITHCVGCNQLIDDILEALDADHNAIIGENGDRLKPILQYCPVLVRQAYNHRPSFGSLTGRRESSNPLLVGIPYKTYEESAKDFTVSSVLDKIRRGRLDLRPSYQRDYVWDKRTASKLIESVLLNIPLPTMFFHERSQGQLEVVDGKQRLTSIWCFMEDQRFPDGSEFALTGLEVLDKLNGNKYLDLDESLREVMQDFALNVHTISRHSDDEVVFEVFERLNMGSTQLNEQELRNCVFQGRYNDLLEELALLPDMLRVFRQETPHKRMRDREFILRFFALRRSGIENFYLPVKNWLNNEMRRHQYLEEEDFMVMKFDFQRCLSLSRNVFGEQIFRLPRGQKYESDPNVCLWDTIMFGFLSYRDDARVLNKKKVLLLALNDLLIYDLEFKTNLLSNPKSLKIRTQKWMRVLRDLLGPS